MRRYNKYKLPTRLRKLRDAFEPFCLPIVVFQMVRTILHPTMFDLLLLVILVCLYILYSKKMI
ncbi:MAG TPA: hypothetical protein VFK44_07945 [Bacillales bacterium]|nr:hypothetical protein [Bacillales bacterium]